MKRNARMQVSRDFGGRIGLTLSFIMRVIESFFKYHGIVTFPYGTPSDFSLTGSRCRTERRASGDTTAGERA
jgi:hypothetical protein